MYFTVQNAQPAIAHRVFYRTECTASDSGQCILPYKMHSQRQRSMYFTIHNAHSAIAVSASYCTKCTTSDRLPCILPSYMQHMAAGGSGPAGVAGPGGGPDVGGTPGTAQKWYSVSYRCHFLVRELEAGHFGARGPVRRPGSGVWAEGLGRRPRTSDSGPCILPYKIHNQR